VKPKEGGFIPRSAVFSSKTKKPTLPWQIAVPEAMQGPIRSSEDLVARIRACLLLFMLFLTWAVAGAQEKKIQPFRVSYSSITATRAPLWIAKEMKIFEKYGLDVAPIHIASGSASYSALLARDVHVVSDTASAAVAAGSRAPIVIFAGSGAIPYKLIAHPSITSLDGLKGKIVGISFVGAGSDFLLRRLLPKLGLTPGKDVTLIPTGIGRSDLRIQLIFQGKIDATLGTADNVSQLALRGLKVGVLGDLAEWGVVTTGGDFATTRQFLKDHRDLVKAFLRGFSEAIWLGKTNREIAIQILSKYLRVENANILDSMHKNYLLGTIPAKPYPLEAAVEMAIEEASPSQPLLKGKRISDFIDVSILKEIEQEGFFSRLYR
jgi:ABC-type nitrate/sulfonate/bicarbonate transport system substrate-binding protein